MKAFAQKYSKGIAAVLGCAVFAAAAFNLDISAWAQAVGLILGTGVTVVVAPANKQ